MLNGTCNIDKNAHPVAAQCCCRVAFGCLGGSGGGAAAAFPPAHERRDTSIWHSDETSIIAERLRFFGEGDSFEETWFDTLLSMWLRGGSAAHSTSLQSRCAHAHLARKRLSTVLHCSGMYATHKSAWHRLPDQWYFYDRTCMKLSAKQTTAFTHLVRIELWWRWQSALTKLTVSKVSPVNDRLTQC